MQKLVPFNNGTQGQSTRVTNNTTSNLTGIIGVATSSSTSGLSVNVAQYGTANCTFDSSVNQGDYVKVSPTINGFCTDAGSTYPTANQVLGVALSSSNAGSTGTSQTIFLFGAEVRGVTASISNTYTVGASSSTPVANGGTISGTSVLYFLANGATATMPAAATAGQIIVVVNASSGFSGSIFVTKAGTNTIFDWGASDSAQTTVGPYQTMTLVSDGNGHWYILHHN